MLNSAAPQIELTSVTPPVGVRALVAGLTVTVPVCIAPGIMVPKSRSLDKPMLTGAIISAVALVLEVAACTLIPKGKKSNIQIMDKTVLFIRKVLFYHTVET